MAATALTATTTMVGRHGGSSWVSLAKRAFKIEQHPQPTPKLATHKLKHTKIASLGWRMTTGTVGEELSDGSGYNYMKRRVATTAPGHSKLASTVHRSSFVSNNSSSSSHNFSDSEITVSVLGID
ncbi:unnamed protein product [Lactuca saligna]|uniref:Uncharacterized protein n=1 Tax=Lactuca saligna TaxID=75948 RepID=A0AA35Z0U8_LACSI|nr:unnamed protein product [Lactuca saligna]